MRFPKEKREQIIQYLLKKINEDNDEFVKKTSQTFDISVVTVYRYLEQLCEEGIIEKNKNGKYTLKCIKKNSKLYYLKDNLEEDIVYREIFKDFAEEFPENIRKIWEYSFSEMFNNAIDHSEAETIFVNVEQNYLYTEVGILDDGIGIFKKICNYFNYEKMEDAITELFKGKLTTDPERHSGEGIFFTSRVMDQFALWSSGKLFTHDNENEVLYDTKMYKEISVNEKGTYLRMRLSNYSKKELREVFDEFSSVDGGFTVTSIPIKNVFDNAYPVSRSQAKRLYNRLDKFEEVILDFSGVSAIGQGFAHELFVVFKREHPDINLEVRNENEEVKRMIQHVCYDAGSLH